MALMTAKEYIDSLRKLNTRVYMFGEKIDNWVDHPMIRPSVSPDTDPTRSPPPSRRVRVFVFDRFEMLDAVGPLEAFATASQILGGGYDVAVASRDGGPVSAASGLTLLSEPLERETAATDTLLVAGGAGVLAAREDRLTIDRLTRAADAARRIGSVCTGAFLLAATGHLAGRRAATHWNWCDRLAAAHPEVSVERDRLFVCDGGVWSSAGVTAGIDLALAMIEADHGAELALAVARELVVHLKRSGGQAQFSVELAAQETRNDGIRRIQDWIFDHAQESLTIDDLAERAAMSPRHFGRMFHRATGRTPARFVEDVRVARACRLLEATRLPIEEIARRTGFRSADVLRRAFARAKGVSPADWRARFDISGPSPPTT